MDRFRGLLDVPALLVEREPFKRSRDGFVRQRITARRGRLEGALEGRS